MKYFLDTEFIEGFHKPLFGKRRHFIDLISIGIVAEDGREYYAISSEFDEHKASKWVKENIISKLPSKTNEWYLADPSTGVWAKEKNVYKTNKQIAKEIEQFINNTIAYVGGVQINPPEFYGYYSDYDWVLFCSLFGTMMDLPNGFPMYCRDLKQMLDEQADSLHPDIIPFFLKVESFKLQKGYPKHTNEHNALSDAKWNFELYKFLTIPQTPVPKTGL